MTRASSERPRRAVAGLVDAGLSSLATFVIGLVAVRYLPRDVLGVYALGYSAFLLGSAVPAMLVYTPAEVRSVNRLDGRDRLAVLSRSLPLGLRVALASAVGVAVATFAVPTDAPLTAQFSVAASLLGLVVLSSGQDHTRHVLHQAKRSWAAAATSATHLLTVVVVLATALVLGAAHQPWLPFSALAAANAASLGGALLVVHRAGVRAAADRVGRISLRSSLREGGALLVGTLASFGAGFSLVAIVAASAGAVAAGQVEGARLLSQPATVVIVGLLAVLTPEVMTAAVQRRARAAMRLILGFLLLSVALVAAYEAVAVVPWPGNPLPSLVPPAYEVENLLAVMIVAQVMQYSGLIWSSVPLALGQRRKLVTVDIGTALVAVAVVLVLRDEGPWAAVIAILIGASLAMVGHAWVATGLLRAGSRAAASDRLQAPASS